MTAAFFDAFVATFDLRPEDAAMPSTSTLKNATP
jgi:hypothetical protein